MVRYLVFLSYIGTRYRGAAKQVGCERLMDMDSIAGAIEMCLHANVYPRSLKKPSIYTSSRTDAGVHALCSSIHVELEHPKEELYDTDRIIAKSNVYFARCGHEIRLLSMQPVTHEFHARASAKSRDYFYRFSVAKDPNCHKVPIGELQRSWHVRGQNIDIDAIKRTIPLFIGRKNFETFAAKNRTNRAIKYVRFMLQVPNNQNWDSRIMIAPPQGLYLKAVNYDPKEVERCSIRPAQAATQEPKALSVC